MLINLTEFRRNKETKRLEEKPLLINPEGIESVQPSDEMEEEEDETGLPIVGMNHKKLKASGIMMRSSRTHLIKEDLNTILIKANSISA